MSLKFYHGLSPANFIRSVTNLPRAQQVHLGGSISLSKERRRSPHRHGQTAARQTTTRDPLADPPGFGCQSGHGPQAAVEGRAQDQRQAQNVRGADVWADQARARTAALPAAKPGNNEPPPEFGGKQHIKKCRAALDGVSTAAASNRLPVSASSTLAQHRFAGSRGGSLG